MRGSNYSAPIEREVHHHVKNPFDHTPEWPVLICVKCRTPIIRFIHDFTSAVFWPEHSSFNDLINDRIKKAIDSHICGEEMPAFKVGSIAININSGYTWKIESIEDLHTLQEGWANGNRNIKLYI